MTGMTEPFEHTGRIVRTSIATTAPTSRAWEAWTEPEILSGWFTDRMTGRAATGGSVTWIFDRFGSKYPYDVLIADPPSRLVLKGNPVGRPPYILEVRISAQPGGGSLIDVVNSGFAARAESPGGGGADDEFEGVVSGWRMALAILAHYLERHFGRPRESFFAMQPARFEYETVRRYFTEAAPLGKWLTRSGSIGAAGSPFSLVLRDGSPMTGVVLATTSREMALSWEEIDGAIELKSFQLSPRQRAVCVRGSAWGSDEERAARVERELASAIDRLVAALEEEGAAGPG